MYEFLLTVHVLAAAIWVGGGVVMHIIGRRALASGDGQKIHDTSKEINTIAPRLYAPLSLILLIAGIFLVNEAGYEFSQLWVILGLVAWLFSFVVGIAYYGPQDKKLQAIVAEKGPTDPGVAGNIRMALNVNAVELAVLLLVIVDMTVKPGA
jgi:uncharacterized membrane protein